jgi:glutamyl-tRNA synthetase
MRRVRIGGPDGAGDVHLAAADLQAARKDEVFRLKDWGNVRFLGEGRAEYAGNDLAILRAGARIVQWVSAAPNASVPVRVHMPDEAGAVKKGLAEVDAVRDFGRLVQFERFGFVRLERQERGAIVAAYAHP